MATDRMTRDLATHMPLDEIHAMWLSLEAQRSLIVEAQDALKSEVRRRCDIGRHATGKGGSIDLAPNRRFSPLRAALILPERVVSDITVPTVDSHRAKDVLTPDEYTDCQVIVGEPRVRFRA